MCSLTIAELTITALQWGSGILVALVVYLFMYGGYFYIELTKVDDHFEIKFYNTFPFSREFKMFRIPISAFVKYEIKGSKFYRRKLVLFQMSSSQMAKYPPILISALSQKDEMSIKAFFKHLKQP